MSDQKTLLDLPQAEYEAHLEEQASLTRLEFRGLTSAQAYKLGFSRLLKLDPLRRVLMMGTDQRDLFVPLLRESLSEFSRGGQFFDVGGGNGETFALVEEKLAPKNPTIHILEPNQEYAESYAAHVRMNKRLNLGHVAPTKLEDFMASNNQVSTKAVAPESQDFVAFIHAIYFMDPEKAVTEIYKWLKPGVLAFIVFADETVSYTGKAVEHFGKAHDPGLAQGNAHDAAERKALLLAPDAGGEGRVIETLRSEFPESNPRLESQVLLSRLYGHTMSDILALAFITALAQADDQPFDEKKIATTRDLLLNHRAEIDLRVEFDGVRQGMFSVTQPQIVAHLTKGLQYIP